MLVPVKAKIEPSEFLTRARHKLEQLAASKLTRESPVRDKAQLHALDDLYLATEDMRPAGITLEHMLHPLQAFLILPLFALFKAGIPLGADSLSQLVEPVSLGIVAGLFIGKPLGITLFAWLAIRSGQADMPPGVSWKQIWGVACVAGVGFTMSIFVGELAFADPALVGTAKMGILLASLVSGILGYLVLNRGLPKANEVISE